MGLIPCLDAQAYDHGQECAASGADAHPLPVKLPHVTSAKERPDPPHKAIRRQRRMSRGERARSRRGSFRAGSNGHALAAVRAGLLHRPDITDLLHTSPVCFSELFCDQRRDVRGQIRRGVGDADPTRVDAKAAEPTTTWLALSPMAEPPTPPPVENAEPVEPSAAEPKPAEENPAPPAP